MIEGDHHQLSQVFTNLIANAFEALDGKGQITISATTCAIEADPAFAGVHPPTPAVLVEVADDGPGVPAELTDRIFNPFFTTKVTGTGLGLAIVRKIVDAHDGRIDVSSTPRDRYANSASRCPCRARPGLVQVGDNDGPHTRCR